MEAKVELYHVGACFEALCKGFSWQPRISPATFFPTSGFEECDEKTVLKVKNTSLNLFKNNEKLIFFCEDC